MPVNQWKPVVYTVPSPNVPQTRDFYANLFGLKLSKSATEEFESYDGQISDGGIDITFKPRNSEYETPMLYFAVQDLDAAVKEAEQLGSRVVWGPEDLKSTDPRGRAGRGAVLLEPGGSALGLMQLEPWTHDHFRIKAR